MRIEVFDDENLPYGAALIFHDTGISSEPLLVRSHIVHSNYKLDKDFKNKMVRVWTQCVKVAKDLPSFTASFEMHSLFKDWFVENSENYPKILQIANNSRCLPISSTLAMLAPHIDTNPNFHYLKGLYRHLCQIDLPSPPPSRKRPRQVSDGIRKIESETFMARHAGQTTCDAWAVESDDFCFEAGTCKTGFVKGKTFFVTLNGSEFVMCQCQLFQLIPYFKPGFKCGNLVDAFSFDKNCHIRGILVDIFVSDPLEFVIYLGTTNERVIIPLDEVVHAVCIPPKSKIAFTSGSKVFAPYPNMSMHPYSMKRVKAIIIDKIDVMESLNTNHYRVCLNDKLVAVSDEFLEQIE